LIKHQNIINHIKALWLSWFGHVQRMPDSRTVNTLRTGDADLHFYITTVQDGWRKSAFFTRAWFPRDIHLITQYIGAFLRMVLLTDVYRNLTSIRIDDLW
jgi:hypothetical protein